MSVEIPNFILPATMASKKDLADFISEYENLDNELENQKIRGSKEYHLPPVSKNLTDFIELNKIDLSSDKRRMDLKQELRGLKDKAPIVHMTFATNADPASLATLVDWMRKELHPWTIISVGLQPSLIGGVYVRTPSHVHDFSMKAMFKGKTELLIKDVKELM